MSFVKMPQDDYVAMCNKLRSMLNETDKYTSKDFIEKMDELILPNLDDMYFGNNSSLPEKGNSNPQYYEDIAKAINEIKQEAAVVLEELNVTESKKYTAPSGVAYSSVNVDIEEGGNPNYVETIEGTVQSPWGGVSVSELVSEIEAGAATAFIEVNNNKVYLSYYPDDGFIGGGVCTSNVIFGGGLTSAIYLNYYSSNGNKQLAKTYTSNGTVSDISNSTVTTLTIIHHPLTDSGT